MIDPSGGPQGARMKLGPYETSEVLGRGGMAVVYKGTQQSLGRVVAIKVLPKEFSRDRQFVGRFHREAESVAKLNHPNIIQIIDKGEDAGICYFVMEYVKGMSLAARLANKGCTLKEMVDIALQVCSALHYAHENGVVHRDIKPANILIDDATGIAKVADFGIAQLAEKSTAIGTLTGDHMAMGTLDYMSPEQKRDAKNVDRRADVYSMGVMLYEMATGRVPMGIFDPPSKLNRDASKDLDVIVMKCLRDKPEERFQSCLELSNALLALPQNPSTMVRVITSVRSGVTNIGTQIGNRNPRYIAAVLGLVIGVGATAWGAVKYGRRWMEPGVEPGDSTATATSTGRGTGTSTEPVVPPVDPDADYKKGLAEALRLKNDGDFAAALARLEELNEKYPGKADCALEIERVKERQQDALSERFRQDLDHLTRGADPSDRAVLEALEKLLKAASDAKVPADVLSDIREQLKAWRDSVAQVDSAKEAAERQARFEKEMTRARTAIQESRWADAEDALQQAAANGTPAQKDEAELLAKEMTAKRSAAASGEEKRKQCREALDAANAGIRDGRLDLARTELARAEELAKGDAGLAGAVAEARREFDLAVKRDVFAKKMKEAQAAEEATPEFAARAYREAAKLAPTEEQGAEANRRAFALEKRVAEAEKEAEYQRQMTSARQARDAQAWADAKTFATNALAARPGDPAARAILEQAQKELTVRPPDPVDPPVPTGKYGLKFITTLPVTLQAGVGGVLDKDGNVLLLDQKLKRIARFSPDLKPMDPVQLAMPAPDDIGIDGQGRVWVFDLKMYKLYRIDLKTGASDAEMAAPGKEPGQIYSITGMAADPAGLVVVDSKNFRLQRFSGDGKHLGTIGSRWDGRTPKDGYLTYAYGVAVGSEGEIYVSDYELMHIQRFAKDGPGKVFKSMTGCRPADLMWAKGRLYVADWYNCRVTVLDKDGQEVGRYGKKGKAVEDFARPSTMLRLPSGKLLVVDSHYGRVTVLEETE